MLAKVSQGDTGTSTSHQKLPALLVYFGFADSVPGILDNLPVTGFQVAKVYGYTSVTLLSWLITSMILSLAHLNSNFLYTNLIMNWKVVLLKSSISVQLQFYKHVLNLTQTLLPINRLSFKSMFAPLVSNTPFVQVFERNALWFK